MTECGRVLAVNVSREKGTIKTPVEAITIDSRGVIGDAHAGDWLRQVSLLASESIEKFAKQIGRQISWGEFAENITTQGSDLRTWRLLDRVRVGEALLQVTQLGKKCHGGDCAIFQQVGRCVMPKEGIFCRVLEPGAVRPGDGVEHLPKQWLWHVLVASDRCSRGEQVDETGPAAQRWLERFAAERKLAGQVVTTVLPDEPQRLTQKLHDALAQGSDAVFICGGTGIGPRDVTPEVVQAFCTKLLPGICEAVRQHYGADNPRALLSRSLAGVRDTMLVFGLPGSPRAVREYLEFIGPVLLHATWMVHGLDAH